MQQIVKKLRTPKTPEVDALGKVHDEIYRVARFEDIDWGNSLVAQITPPIAPPWAKLRGILDGDPSKPYTQINPGQQFTLVFAKPVWLGWVLMRLTTPGVGAVCVMTVQYVDGGLENLTYAGNLVLGSYDVWQPPQFIAKPAPLPVHAITFVSNSVVAEQIFQMVLNKADFVSNAGGGGVPPVPPIPPSTNNFYSDEVIAPVPPGLLGVNLVFGFNTIAFLIHNASPQAIQISEDGGVTWERIPSNATNAFDWKDRTAVLIRDPLGVGGQQYEFWAW